jgi:hypothetical protein
MHCCSSAQALLGPSPFLPLTLPLGHGLVLTDQRGSGQFGDDYGSSLKSGCPGGTCERATMISFGLGPS